MPLPFLLLLAGLGLALWWLGWRRLGLAGVLAGLVGLALVSWSPVADRLLSPFESQYAVLNDQAVVADLDYVVVLGGGWDSLSLERPAGIRLSESSTARLFEGLRLVELARVADNLDAKLVVSGASRLDEPPIAWGYRDAALGLGLKPEQLVVLDRPTDTGAEARAFADWLPSASHLRKTERAWYEFLAGLVVKAEH